MRSAECRTLSQRQPMDTANGRLRRTSRRMFLAASRTSEAPLCRMLFVPERGRRARTGPNQRH